ncbi:hypothetical protein ACFL0W_04890 [Nanoarchaeota archaeon]
MKKLLILCIISLFVISSAVVCAQSSGGGGSGGSSSYDPHIHNYPNFFFTSGMFGDVIVVGDDPAPEDVVSAFDIAASLQGIENQNCGPQPLHVGYILYHSFDNLTLGETLWRIDDEIDSSEMQDVLADEEYDESEGDNDNEESYTQTLNFYSTTGKFVFEASELGDEISDFYVKWDDISSEFVYKYILEFDNEIIYNNANDASATDDFKGSKIEIQGKEYTFIDISLTLPGGKIDTMTLIGGSIARWLSEDKTLTFVKDSVDHDITLFEVTAQEDSCAIEVDGSSAWVDVGITSTINGISIGVVDAKQIADGEDICDIYIDAEKIELRDLDAVLKEGVEIDGSETNIREIVAGEMTQIEIYYAPPIDPLYLSTGQKFVEPALGNFDIEFAELTRTVEEIELILSGKNGDFTFNNRDGTEVLIPIIQDGDNGIVKFGNKFSDDGDSSNDELLYFEGDTCTGTSILNDCEGSVMWIVTSGGEAHVLEITEIGDNTVDFKDLTYGTFWVDKDINTDGTPSQISLGSIGTINLSFDKAAKTITFVDLELGHVTAESEFDAKIIPEPNPGNDAFVEIWIEEQSHTFNDADTDRARIVLSIMNNTAESSPELVLSTPNIINLDGSGWDDTEDAYGSGWYSESLPNDEIRMWATHKGTLLSYDADNDDYVLIEHPEEEVYAKIVINNADNQSTYVKCQSIDPDLIKTDSEIQKIKNITGIVIGNPNTNYKIMNLHPEFYNDVKPGTGIAKIFTYNNKTQLLVGGYNPEDTRKVSRVLSVGPVPKCNETMYVKGTNINNITISCTPFATSVTSINDIADISEFGKIIVNSNKKTVYFTADRFENPVVIAKALSYNGNQPAHIRIIEVEDDNFVMKIEEWFYLDGSHTNEEVSYVVIESGNYILDGKKIEVGKLVTKHGFRTKNFWNTFDQIPVVLSQSQSRWGGDPIISRNRNITTDYFQLRFKEEENPRDTGAHKFEVGGYIAAEPGVYTGTGTEFEVGKTGREVEENWYTINFAQSYSRMPSFLTDIQSHLGGNTANLRYRNLGNVSAELFIQEETSLDSETNHVLEEVGFFVLN